MVTRSEGLLAPVSRDGLVIEIGPSFSPIAPRSEGWNVRTVDHTTRSGLIAKYKDNPTVDVSRIEDVDYVWNGGPISDIVPEALHKTFDAFISSHVIEHTTDLIEFLNSAAVLLKPDGVVVLAIPDKRYCFDYFQPLTTTGQVIDAHLEERSRHSRRLVFDHFAYCVSSGGAIAWSQQPPLEFGFIHSLEQAYGIMESSEESTDYIDTHAWRFSPASFELLMLELARLDQTDWRVESVTPAVGCEFYAWLRAGGKEAAAAMSAEALAAKRLALLKQTLLETKDQIDWLLAGEPNLPNARALAA